MSNYGLNIEHYLIIFGLRYQFGDFRETISSVLGKNQRDGTLSKKGEILVSILDFIDKDHCKKSINNF